MSSPSEPTVVRDDPDDPDPGFVCLYTRLPAPVTLEPWLGWARTARPPVLYLGIGAGRLAAPLAATGVQIVGVDAHPGMLDVLRRRVPDITAVQAKIEDLDLGSRFDLVIVPSNVLCTPARLLGAARHVATNGRLAFELTNPHWLATTSHPQVRVVSFSRGLARVEVAYDPPGGGPVIQAAAIPLVWPEEIEGFLAPAGLRLIQLLGPTGASLRESPSFYVLTAPHEGDSLGRSS